MDEEEFAMLKKIKVLRASYQDQYEQLKVVRSEIEYCSGLVDQCRQKFMAEFEQWYETIYGGQGNDNATLNGIPEVSALFNAFLFY
jgi:kinesin family protein 6/9